MWIIKKQQRVIHKWGYISSKAALNWLPWCLLSWGCCCCAGECGLKTDAARKMRNYRRNAGLPDIKLKVFFIDRIHLFFTKSWDLPLNATGFTSHLGAVQGTVLKKEFD
jgi:hypothetical protein